MSRLTTLVKKIAINVIIMICVLPMLSSSLGNGSVAYADSVFYKVNAKGGLHMRAGATVDSRIVHTMDHGTKVKYIGKKGNWLLVQTKSGKRGYCFKKYLTDTGEASKKDSAKTSGKLYFVNSVKKIKVYKSNSTKSGVRGKLNGGTVVRLISYKGNWGYIETYNTGKKGFMQLKYLKKY